MSQLISSTLIANQNMATWHFRVFCCHKEWLSAMYRRDWLVIQYGGYWQEHIHSNADQRGE